MTPKEYRVDCARCGIDGAEFREDLDNPFCGACYYEIVESQEEEPLDRKGTEEL